MFEQSFIPKPARTKRAWSVVLSFSTQMVVVGIAVLIPFIATDRIPLATIRDRLIEPTPPTGKTRTPPHLKIVASGKLPPQQVRSGKIFEPTRIPPQAQAFVDPPPAPPDVTAAECIGCVPGSVPGSPGPGSLSRILTQPPPVERPKAVSPPKPREPEIVRIRRGGEVQAAQLIHRVTPIYPDPARRLHISGVVRLHALIGADGLIRELRLMSGHPLLVPAAIDAVRQWMYRPTLLNGEPVEVVTEIEVRFILAR